MQTFGIETRQTGRGSHARLGLRPDGAGVVLAAVLDAAAGGARAVARHGRCASGVEHRDAVLPGQRCWRATSWRMWIARRLSRQHCNWVCLGASGARRSWLAWSNGFGNPFGHTPPQSGVVLPVRWLLGALATTYGAGCLAVSMLVAAGVGVAVAVTEWQRGPVRVVRRLERRFHRRAAALPLSSWNRCFGVGIAGADVALRPSPVCSCCWWYLAGHRGCHGQELFHSNAQGGCRTVFPPPHGLPGCWFLPSFRAPFCTG